MKNKLFEKFLAKQKEEIEKAKWFEGIRIGRDPGNGFVLEWIKKYAASARDNFAACELQEIITEFENMLEDFASYYYDVTKLRKKLDEIVEKIKDVKVFLHGN